MRLCRIAMVGLLGLAASGAQAQSTPIYSYTVPAGGYAPNGNIVQHTDQITGTWTMQYDNLNRLTNATSTAGYSNGVSVGWTYDSFGNRLTQTPSASGPTGVFLPVAVTATYGPNNQMWTNNAAPVRTVDGNGNVLAGVMHDGAGNVIFDGVNQMAYDAENKLCAVYNTMSGGAITQYLYNAEGQRVAKGHPTDGSMTLACATDMTNFTPTATYVLGQAGEQLTELNGQGTWQHTNVFAGGQLLATYDSTGVHFPFTDPLGTKRIQASASGAVELTCYSLPFGDGPPCMIPPGAPASADEASEHRFTGKERDIESGLDYFGARYFGSNMGRFMSPDSSEDPVAVPFADLSNPQSLNLYSYVYNNPLSNIDPDGHTCQTNSTDGNAYDDGDGQGCATVDQQNADRLKNGQYSATVTAPYDTSQLQEQATRQQYLTNLQSQQPAQISLQGRQFIQQVAANTAGVPTVCSVGAYAQVGLGDLAVGGSYNSNSGGKGYANHRAAAVGPVSVNAKIDTNGKFSGGVTVRDPVTGVGGGVSVDEHDVPTVSASEQRSIGYGKASVSATVGANATLGTIGDPRCQHP